MIHANDSIQQHRNASCDMVTHIRKQQINRIKIAWWNLGLDGAQKNANDIDHYRARTLLQRIITEETIDGFFLGEVDKSWLSDICIGLDKKYKLFNIALSESEPRSSYIGLIYNSDSINVDKQNQVFCLINSKQRTAAITFRMILKYSSISLYICCVHWPAQLNNCIADGPEYVRRAEAIREHLSNYKQSKEGLLSKSMIIGDFNEEPFNKSLSEYLQATRDRDLAISWPDRYYYNPFWRMLGADKPFSNQSTLTSGTYYYYRGQNTKWHTFDQVIVSASLIDDSCFRILEESIRKFQSVELIELLKNRKCSFDHLPIIVEFEFANQED